MVTVGDGSGRCGTVGDIPGRFGTVVVHLSVCAVFIPGDAPMDAGEASDCQRLLLPLIRFVKRFLNLIVLHYNLYSYMASCLML